MRFLPYLAGLAVGIGCASAMPAGAETPLRQVIDAEIRAGWERAKVKPEDRADDSAFLRRIYLDLLGTIPAYEETVAFLKDTGGDKREKLIDRLLSDPRFAVQQARIWDRVLMGKRSRGDDPKPRL